MRMINMLLAAVFTCVKHLAEMSSAFQGKIWATCALRYKFCGSVRLRLASHIVVDLCVVIGVHSSLEYSEPRLIRIRFDRRFYPI